MPGSIPPAASPIRKEASTSEARPGLTPTIARPRAPTPVAARSSCLVPKRRARRPLGELTRRNPARLASSRRPRAESGRPRSWRIEGQATPRAPSGIPRTTKAASETVTTRLIQPPRVGVGLIGMPTQLEREIYPFAAIVGQERMKLALVANAISPAIGGVLIRGERGTGKSTAVRGLARLLPEQHVVEGCHFGCDPDLPEALCVECRMRAEAAPLPVAARHMRVVELPINASEDRVVGSIDLEAALQHGHRRFEPGVLAEANRNLLYVDEVNLLDDHIVDVLLDAAAMGVNVVEREGVSVVHPARFILVGTMNPEEGELRPQLLDRFGLCVDVEGIRDADQRIEIAERDAAFRSGDETFTERFLQADKELAGSLSAAIAAFPALALAPGPARRISAICVEAGVQGHRADVVTEQTARALAALRRRTSPTRDDIYD